MDLIKRGEPNSVGNLIDVRFISQRKKNCLLSIKYLLKAAVVVDDFESGINRQGFW